jgi:hypothetical protein
LSNIDDVLWDAVKIVVIDDFSLEGIPDFLIDKFKGKIHVIELTRNLGHQKAIAIALCYAAERFPEYSSYIVMDSDGEDRPCDVTRLISALNTKKYSITFAHREKRNESIIFKIGYETYKFVYRGLTGSKITFGNFCVITSSAAKRLIHVSEVWVHFSSAIIKSRIDYNSIPTIRGKRYLGKSKMNFSSLVSHGLSALAVFSEIISARIILITFGLSIAAILGIIAIVTIKNLTELAIPGWASISTLAMALMISQFFSLGVLLSFIVLSAKTVKNINPARIYKEYIHEVYVI